MQSFQEPYGKGLKGVPDLSESVSCLSGTEKLGVVSISVSSQGIQLAHTPSVSGYDVYVFTAGSNKANDMTFQSSVD